MATYTNVIQARVDPFLKQKAESVLRTLGITPTEAIRLFYAQIDLQQGLPFEVRLPNATTVAALKEAEHPDTLPSYQTVDDLFADIE